SRGGKPFLVTLPVLSPRVWRRVTPTVAPAATTAAAVTTATTLALGLIAGQPSHRKAAIFMKVMPSYRDLPAQVKAEIDEIDILAARDRDALFLDVRELDEWIEGRIPGAIHIPRGNLESRIERAAPDRSQPIIVYCAAGNRSAFAAKSLAEL